MGKTRSAKPANAYISDETQTTFKINFTPRDATTYHIRINKPIGNDWKELYIGTCLNGQTLMSLTPGTRYLIHLWAADWDIANKTDSDSLTLYATTHDLPPKPGTPTNLRTSDETRDSAIFRFDYTSNADRYWITVNGGVATIVDSGQRLLSLYPRGQRNTVVLWAENLQGKGGDVRTDIYTKPDPPSPPYNIDVHTRSGAVTFNASDDGGGDNNITYWYSYLDPLDNLKTKTGPIQRSQTIPNAFSPGVTYTLNIHANNRGGDSASASKTFTMDIIQPDSPHVDYTYTNSSVQFTISGPTNKGGAASVTYVVKKQGVDRTANPNSTNTTAALPNQPYTGLDYDTDCSYQFYALNSAGYSKNPGTVVTFRTKCSPPGPPTDVKVGIDSGYLYFRRPAFTGFHYNKANPKSLSYSYSIDNGNTKKTIQHFDDDTTYERIGVDCSDTFKKGRTYSVYVYAKNDDSISLGSLVFLFTMTKFPPSVVKNIKIGRGNGHLTLERPDDDGGDSGDMEIHYQKSLTGEKENMEGSWDTDKKKWSGKVIYKPDELLNVWVYARNSSSINDGYSLGTLKVITMTVIPPPAPAQNLKLEPDTGFLTFEPPDDDGGDSDIKYYYTSTYNPFNPISIEKTGGFINYEAYTQIIVTVYTENNAGKSNTTATKPFMMGAGQKPPSKPLNIDLSYNDNDKKYHMFFDAPSSNGGSKITQYSYKTTTKVSSTKPASNNPSKEINSGDVLTDTEAGFAQLNSNTIYKVFLYATNKNGTGEPASSSCLTPPKDANQFFASYYQNVFLEYNAGISSLSKVDTSTDCITLYSNVSDNLNRLKYNYALLNKYVADNNLSQDTPFRFQTGDYFGGDIKVSAILTNASSKLMDLSASITGLVKNNASRCGYNQLSEDQQSSIYLAQRNKVGPLNYNIVENQGITNWPSAKAIEDDYLSTAYLLMPSNMNKQIYIDDYIGLSGEVTKVENNVEFSKLSITTENFAVRETFINPYYSEITPAASVSETTVNPKNYTIKTDALRIYNKYLNDISDISNQLLDDSSSDSIITRLITAQKYLDNFTRYVIDISNALTSASNQLTDAATEYQNYKTHKQGYVFYSPNEEAAKANKASAKADYLEVYKYYCAIFNNIEYSTESLMITLLAKLLNISIANMDTYYDDIIKLDADNKKLDVNADDFVLTIETQLTTLEDKMASASSEIININKIQEFYTKMLESVLKAFNNLTLTPLSIFVLPMDKLPDISPRTIYSIPKPVKIAYYSGVNSSPPSAPLLTSETTNFTERISLYNQKIDGLTTTEIVKYQLMVGVEIDFFESNVNDIIFVAPNEALQKILDDIHLLSKVIKTKELQKEHLMSTIYGDFDFETNKYDHGIVNDSRELTVKYIEKLKDLTDAIYTQNEHLQKNESKVDKVTPLQEKYYKNQTIQSGLMYSNVFFVIYILLFAVICYILYAQPDGSLYTKIFSILFLLSYPFWIYPSEYFIYQFVVAVVSRISNTAKSLFVLLTRMNNTY
jgi:hypothetical protein